MDEFMKDLEPKDYVLLAIAGYITLRSVESLVKIYRSNKLLKALHKTTLTYQEGAEAAKRHLENEINDQKFIKIVKNYDE